MYQLVLGLGWDALKTRFQSYDQNPHVGDWKRIEQHKILYNNKITEYYEEQAIKEGMNPDIVKSYFASRLYTITGGEKTNAAGQNIAEIFRNYFKHKGYDEGAVLYGSNAEMEMYEKNKNKPKYQFDITKGVFEDKKNLLSMYSTDNVIILYPNESATLYLRFIRHMLANEKVVCFIDPYIAENPKTRGEFCNTYLSMVSMGASVNVFLAKDEGTSYYNELRQAAEERNVKLMIFPCIKDTMHDRFITTSDVILNIGAGLLFYKNESDDNGQKVKVIRETTVFGYRKKENAADLEVEKRLAGGKVDDPQ